MAELMKGVHRITANANSYLLLDDKVLLFDTTIEPSAKDILAYLPKARLQPCDIQVIVLTHTHPDHTNGLHTMKAQAPRARVAAHEADADFVSKAQPNYPGPPVNGKPSPWQGVPVDDRLRDGQVYEGLRVIHCPGHTPGTIALLDEDRGLLIAGDTLRTEGGVGPMWDQYNIDPKQHREGIRKLARFAFDALVCGHGEPILQGAGEQVRQLARTL
ncbi:MAG: MBL fold metallo-hydrolase [Halobacteriales archaeon]|nr:MBL fold metallo-hydrolase [Halobacteriales archaeon]